MFVRFSTLEEGLFPIAIAVKTTPIVAVAPLLVIWLGTGWWSKIVAVILICFFPVLVNAVKGLKAADAEYRELFQTLGASRSQEFRKLRIPYCLPYLFSALKISSSLAIVGAIVGEFVGATQGLGYLIMVSSAHLETATLFAAIAAAALAGIAMFYAIGWTEEARHLLAQRQYGMTMRTTSVDVVQIPTKGPGDVSGLMNLIEAGKIEPASILAILGKTEGNGGVNDFTREYAVSALSGALAPYVDLPPHDVEQKIAFVMSGGTEGVLSPHITVFARATVTDGDSGGKNCRQAFEHRHRTHARFHARRAWPRRANRRDRKRRSHSDGGCRYRRSRKTCILFRSNARC